MNLCAKCASINRDCCTGRDIILTDGDISRIINFNQFYKDFFELRVSTDSSYFDTENDPVWFKNTINLDKTRRVIKHQNNNKCFFITQKGCALPLNIRPLVCRLHPLEYIQNQITGISNDCPKELLDKDEDFLKSVGIDLNEANEWLKQLYYELETRFEKCS